MPTFGVQIHEGVEPAGYATIIPNATPSIEGIDMFITGWSDPIHDLESRAGTERLEDGSTITDHVSAMPAKLSMTGWVSDLSQGGDAPAIAWEAIRELHSKESILKVVTEWGVYNEMFITSVNTTQETRGMQFTIDLQEIVRVGLLQGDTQAIRRDPEGPAANRTEEVNQGKVAIPGVDLGDGRFLTGLPGSPNRQIITTHPDGSRTIAPFQSEADQ